MAPSSQLGALEELVLLAVMRLGNDAYGASIRKELRKRAGRAPTVSTSYVTLLRLEEKGLVRSHTGESTSPRGGRPKRLFTLTARGVQALRSERAVMERMWEGLDTELGGERGR
jgi:DNA-binding PadR family transcriptional regulator